MIKTRRIKQIMMMNLKYSWQIYPSEVLLKALRSCRTLLVKTSTT